jgi:hypothetical protein
MGVIPNSATTSRLTDAVFATQYDEWVVASWKLDINSPTEARPHIVEGQPKQAIPVAPTQAAE